MFGVDARFFLYRRYLSKKANLKLLVIAGLTRNPLDLRLILEIADQARNDDIIFKWNYYNRKNGQSLN